MGGSKKKDTVTDSSTSTELSTFSVHDALKKVDNAIKQIQSSAGPEDKTKGSISIPGAGTIKISEEKSVTKLVELAAYLTAKQEAYNNASKVLNVGEVPVLKIDGALVTNWLTDIRKRIVLAKAENKLNALKALKKEYEALLSDEDKKRSAEEKFKRLMSDIDAVE